MKRTGICLLAAFAVMIEGWCIPAGAAILGEWTAYPAFANITEVERGGNNVYVLSSASLYSVNTNDNSVTTYDKTKTLSDSEIAHIAWCAAAKKLVIVYSNQNIDLLEENGNVSNVSDYYSKSLTMDKTVNAVNVVGKNAYLSTGFGIVQVNVADAEISNTYTLGFAVNWTHVDDNRIYAESKAEGQYSASLSSNLLDKSNWTRTAGYTAENKTIDKELLSFAEEYRPNGPASNYFGFMRLHDGVLYSVPGKNDDMARPAYVQIKNGDIWTVTDNTISYESKPWYRNIFEVDVDPSDNMHWFTAAVPGLYEYRNGEVVANYYCDNSIIERATTVPEGNVDYSEVTTLKYDNEGNLWLIQGIAATPCIIKLDKEGNFSQFRHDELLTKQGYTWVKPRGLDFDSRGLLWFVNCDWRIPALASYNINTDELTVYKEFVNEDATEVNLVYGRCWAEDKEGNIWFGTDVGPIELLASDIGTSGTVTFQQVKIPRDDGSNLADYLLSGVDVNCMAVDGGNRKWFGTSGLGVYVVSSDNMEQVYHFTSENSGLLSDNIESIVIDDATGEVYIATDKGLCSYSSDATGSNETLEKDNIYAYPNPVKPDYTGDVTIVGLAYDTEIHITTSSGQLVAQGRSNGGTFIWNTCDLQGRRVASGVYMVMTATADGKKGVVTKVAVVR